MNTKIDDPHKEEYSYGEEVLNASWLPQDMLAPELHPAPQSVEHFEASETSDLEGFMNRIYAGQE